MRILIALGGNALQRRGEPMSVAAQRLSVRQACRSIAGVAEGNDLVVTHGNGPQVGLLALQAGAYDPVSAYPFDVLDAATEGMIGYLIEQELGNLVPEERRVVTLLTQTQIDPRDPALSAPTKFVGPVYTRDEAQRRATEHGWTVRPDGPHYRRVVPSPRPVRIVETAAIRTLLGAGMIVICAGGGGIPTALNPETGELLGVEAVIDKDRSAAVLARDLRADLLVIATEVDGVYLDWGTPVARLIVAAHPDVLAAREFPAGSMGPKVEAAVEFVRETGATACIGALKHLGAMLRGESGTRVATDVDGLLTEAQG